MTQLSLMIVFSVFLSIPFLWVWKIKHPSRSLWKAWACFIALLYGIPFAAGFFLGTVIDFNTSALGLIFRLDPQTSAGLAKTSVGFMAALASLPPVYIARKIIQTPLVGQQKARESALTTGPELSHHQSV